MKRWDQIKMPQLCATVEEDSEEITGLVRTKLEETLPARSELLALQI